MPGADGLLIGTGEGVAFLIPRRGPCVLRQSCEGSQSFTAVVTREGG